MKFSYYPGCSLHATAVEYDLSTKAVFNSLGLTLEEVPDWNCCGATSAHATDENLNAALNLRNLAIAESLKNDIVIPCAACYNNAKVTDYKVKAGEEYVKDLNDQLLWAIGKNYEASINVRHSLEVLYQEEILNNIKKSIVKPLKGLKVASYYGCLLLRPAKMVAIDDPEQPKKMDKLMSLIGAEPVKWSAKTECCGGSFSISQTNIVLELVKNIISSAKASGADVIASACPLCLTNLDTRQNKAVEEKIIENPMPVLYFTELLGLAMGLEETPSWLKKHLINPVPVLQSANLF
ncbi:CoB--CoM heterodisulfide reductase iron-sulfur subunit B family protein [Desulfolucanica intricata]|uniref:CoB--CoM heterodisulfide reductase iron-sulfur subunit B family protein n=1 Tax=Desulfolucanica intricata TaxID=1285191 RepID=UPI00082EBB20|nr:CoB--CoM heterodisulfide reductase iron-sulfur subunit B family protein [Desulfolucanica intricata]